MERGDADAHALTEELSDGVRVAVSAALVVRDVSTVTEAAAETLTGGVVVPSAVADTLPDADTAGVGLIDGNAERDARADDDVVGVPECITLAEPVCAAGADAALDKVDDALGSEVALEQLEG